MAWCCRVISALKPSFPKPTSTTTYISIFCRWNHLSQTVCSVSCLEEIAECGIHSLSDHPNPEIASFYQKGFSEISKEVSGRELHALCLKGFVPLSIFYLNTLVNMYSKFGCIRNARNVFNYMLERNEASWNNMMSGYVRVAMYREAIEFFRDMWDCGIKPSDFFIASVVTACNKSASMLGEGLQVHGLLVKIGLLVDVFVGTSLVHFYGIYGFVFDAQKFFDGMPYRNVVTWTSLMVGYSVNEELMKVIDTYKCIIRKNISCNENTMALVIRTCGMLGDDLLGLQMHGNVMKSGLVTNVSVANSIIAMYCSVGRVEGSCYIFDHMDEHDTISWNSIISAHAQNGRREGSFRYFHQMRHVHKEVNAVTLSSLLTACSSVDNLKWGRGIHALVIKMGLESNEYVGNTLLKMYSAGGRSEDAGLVFQRMPERDLISWNSLVACYVENEECRKALELFGEMLQIGRMNYVTLTSSLAACTNTEFLVEGKILHALAVLQGLQNNLVVGNALVTMYGKTGRTADAKKVLLTMPHRDEVTCNSLIGSYAENREPIEAIEVFNIMRDEGIKTNYITMINLLGACLTSDALTKHGMPIHAHLILTGFVSDIYVQSSLLTMYARCGELNSSRFLFDGLAHKNSILWNAIIAAHASNGCKEDALKLILEMRHAGFDLDQFSLSEALSVCAALAILEEGQQLHGFAIKLGLESDHYVTNAAMDMYGKCGEMENVLRMVPLPLHRSRLSWNTLISSFARHGCFQKAMEIFHEMLNWGKKPDHVTFVSLLTACSHGGLVDEGLAYYASMTTKFGIPPGIEHCVNIVDLLGRSGRLAEAENFIKEMPVPPNDIVWRSLLASCKVHTNLELGRKAAECLLRLDPTDDSAYVLYSNVCATTGRWDDVENVRSIMGLGNIKKQPACSWVKLKDQIYKFGMGDNSHPQSDQIYSKLSELMKMLREAGYIADTSYALQDTDEEQKEHNLWNHSERIALAFGLLNAPKTSPVRVFKNLRVCGDCHSVYKYVSRLIGRKIILRDPYRFHHFTMASVLVLTIGDEDIYKNEIHHIINPDPYGGVFGSDAKLYAKDFQDHTDYGTLGKVARFIAETVKGVQGAVELAPAYLKLVCDITHKAGGVCITGDF